MPMMNDDTVQFEFNANVLGCYYLLDLKHPPPARRSSAVVESAPKTISLTSKMPISNARTSIFVS